MTERRWMSMDEVFDQLEAAETEYLLQAWERDGAPEGPAVADVADEDHTLATGPASRRVGAHAAR